MLDAKPRKKPQRIDLYFKSFISPIGSRGIETIRHIVDHQLVCTLGLGAAWLLLWDIRAAKAVRTTLPNHVTVYRVTVPEAAEILGITTDAAKPHRGVEKKLGCEEGEHGVACGLCSKPKNISSRLT